MSKTELAQKLAQMTQSMEEARRQRNHSAQKIHHQIDPESWELLKLSLNYRQPSR